MFDYIFKYLDIMDRDALLIHLVFGLICVIVLLFPAEIGIGLKMLILVLIYNFALPVFALARGRRAWIEIWLFAFILSLFQVFPDWFLSAQLNILAFPEDGFRKIGTVSLYMAGLWAIPVFIIIYVFRRVKERFSEKSSIPCCCSAFFNNVFCFRTDDVAACRHGLQRML